MVIILTYFKLLSSGLLKNIYIFALASVRPEEALFSKIASGAYKIGFSFGEEVFHTL